MRVHCEMCDSMVPVEEVHSCFDAALLKQQQEAKKEAERAVIDAAVAWLDVGGGSLVELVFAVKNLRKLEAEV